ncbi:hypothetical protein B0I35DRAFT_446031 [Stachybotrys elegans]|uniref:Orc1-like AAA ATPase domain-containing protein n=1 Tax=Stachybotrys elegans TaxID=80388 RepID=A0A8K0SDP0_9HYPO|nr:hypothetical protein B0I35DRAFT_446031 [Stachybotrys elegans]
MKLIAGHPHTAKALSTWAGPNQLVTACHYLWSPGTAMQKSLEGLFRSILYSILRGAPELIPAVCSSERTKSSASANAPWLKAELIATMQNFAQLTESPVKCCIFIDELDALDWGLPEAVLLISDFAQSPHCKICVSSRPWNLFEFAFGSDPMRRLRIHDLTRPDTEAYVRVQLENHPSWPYNQGRDGTAAYLIREITDRADGVFLWVVLVTKSILMGVTNGDTISVLRQRIDAFPTDMESLFKESLETVSPFYRENMADSLLIALAATSPLHVAIYHFCQEGDYDAQPTRPLTVKELSDLVQNTSRRLENQSKGLLEVRNDNCVHFLHRTVCDFLLTAEMTNYLQTRCRRNFSPSLSIFRASVEWIKRSSFPSEIDNRGEPDVNNQPQLGQALLTSALTEALQYATISKAENEVATHGALGALERSIGTMAESGQIILSWEAGGLSAAIQARHLFRELAHQFGLGGYLQMQEG